MMDNFINSKVAKLEQQNKELLERIKSLHSGYAGVKAAIEEEAIDRCLIIAKDTAGAKTRIIRAIREMPRNHSNNK